MAGYVDYTNNSVFSADDWNESVAYGFWKEHNSTDSFYCVWTDNRWHSEVATTEYHEACHELVSKDYDHFCDHKH